MITFENNFFKRNAPYYWKALFWLCLNAIIGFLPLLIINFLNKLNISKKISDLSADETLHLLRDCIIMFGSCIIIGAVWVDFMVSKLEVKKYIVILVSVPAWIVIFITILIYVVLLLDKIDDPHFINLLTLQKCIGVFAITYTLAIKPILYKKEDIYE